MSRVFTAASVVPDCDAAGEGAVNVITAAAASAPIPSSPSNFDLVRISGTPRFSWIVVEAIHARAWLLDIHKRSERDGRKASALRCHLIRYGHASPHAQ